MSTPPAPPPPPPQGKRPRVEKVKVKRKRHKDGTRKTKEVIKAVHGAAMAAVAAYRIVRPLVKPAMKRLRKKK